MKNSRFSLSTVAVMAAFSSISAAQAAPAADAAQAPNESWYVGLSAGQSSTTFSSSDFSYASAVVTESSDRNKTGGKFFMGYDFNKNWAVELGYAGLGRPKFKYDGVGVASGASAHREVREESWNLVAKGSLPINEQFGLFGKLGATWNRSQASFNLNSTNAAFTAAVGGTSYTNTKTRSDVLVGVGAQFYFNKNVAVRVEYEDFGRFGSYGVKTDSTGTTRASMWSAGVSYNF